MPTPIDATLNVIANTKPIFPKWRAQDPVSTPLTAAQRGYFATETAMDTQLKVGGYKDAQLSRMSKNDKIYALRVYLGLV